MNSEIQTILKGIVSIVLYVVSYILVEPLVEIFLSNGEWVVQTIQLTVFGFFLEIWLRITLDTKENSTIYSLVSFRDKLVLIIALVIIILAFSWLSYQNIESSKLRILIVSCSILIAWTISNIAGTTELRTWPFKNKDCNYTGVKTVV